MIFVTDDGERQRVLFDELFVALDGVDAHAEDLGFLSDAEHVAEAEEQYVGAFRDDFGLTDLQLFGFIFSAWDSALKVERTQ